MKISIITVCRNAEETIADCLDSIASQTHVDVEHLVIDGASTDRTLEIVEEKAKEARVISEPDDGMYFALNKGLELAAGDVIGFLHADDRFESELVLAHVAETLTSEPESDGCFSDLVYVDAGNTEKVVRHWVSSDFESGSFAKGWMPPHPTFYARREVYESMAGFDTSMKIGADWEFLLRFFEKEKRLAIYVPEVWVRMRLGGVSNRTWRNVLLNNLETWRVAIRHLGFWRSLLFPIRKLFHRLKQF